MCYFWSNHYETGLFLGFYLTISEISVSSPNAYTDFVGLETFHDAAECEGTWHLWLFSLLFYFEDFTKIDKNSIFQLNFHQNFQYNL